MKNFDVFPLSDTELLKLHNEARNEIARRTAAELEGVDRGALIKGHEMCKRAILVAAAGDHSLLFVGPKGCGKTMLRAMAAEVGLTKTFESRCCPCGFHMDPLRACSCTVDELKAFVATFPEADMVIEVCPVPEREMRSTFPGTSVDDLINRLENSTDHTSKKLDESSAALLKSASVELGIEAAVREVIVDVARTIANLDGSEFIRPHDMAEAINYRPLERIAL